jgi:hypothetical protein
MIGYFLAMLIRKYWEEGKDKVTFGGVVGTALSQNSKYRSLFAGIAVYELGHNAGITLLPTKPEAKDKNMGKIIAPTKYEEVEYRENFFKVDLSSWKPLYVEKVGERKTKKGTVDVWENNLDKTLYNPYQENGIYFIQDDKGEVVYIGLVSQSKDGFHRLLRHFSEDDGKRDKILNHDSYPKNKGYKFRIAQIQNTNNHYRRQLLEEYYQWKYKPRDSFTYKMQYQIVFAEDQDTRIVQSILNNNEELAERHSNLEKTTEEPSF